MARYIRACSVENINRTRNRVTPESLRTLQALAAPGATLLRRTWHSKRESYVQHVAMPSQQVVHPRTLSLLLRAGWLRSVSDASFVLTAKGRDAMRRNLPTITKRLARRQGTPDGMLVAA